MHSNSQNPNWQWAKAFGGTSIEDILGIATDNTGNSYVCGYYYSSTMTIGSFSLTSQGNFDFFVAKFDNAGNPQWVKNFGGQYDDTPLSIAIDGLGNSFVTGNFVSPTLVCGTNTLVNSGFGDMFLMKLDINGNLQWAKNFGNGGTVEGKGIATDLSGNVFVTGFFNGSTLALGTVTLSSNGNDDCFISKFDTNGNEQWAINIGDNLNESGNDVATDAAGNIFVTGYFKSGTITAGTYTLNNNTVTSADLFLIKCSNTGSILAANSTGDMFDEIGTSITIDASGNALITGYFFGTTLTVGTYTLNCFGGKDMLIIKCNNNGGFVWAKNAGGMFDDYGNAIGTDALGNIYVNGHNHSPTAFFDTYSLTVSGVGGDGFIASYSTLGNVLWASGTGAGTDDGWDCLSLDGAGNIYVGGFFTSPSISIGSNTLVTNGNADMMLAKINSSNGIADFENKKAGKMLLYPNPTTGKFYISVTARTQESVLEVFSSNGILNKSIDLNSDTVEIDLSDFPKGLYFIRYRTKNFSMIEKVILN